LDRVTPVRTQDAALRTGNGDDEKRGRHIHIPRSALTDDESQVNPDGMQWQPGPAETTTTGGKLVNGGGRVSGRLVQRLPGSISSYYISALDDGSGDCGLYRTVESDEPGIKHMNPVGSVGDRRTLDQRLTEDAQRGQFMQLAQKKAADERARQRGKLEWLRREAGG
jgi:hypothetical protein